MRFRKTEICQTCCRLKNVCQSCILDLQYALPVQIRDGVLQIKDSCPQNEANREYFLATNAAKLARNDVSLIDYDKSDPAAKAVLEQLSEKYAARSNRDGIVERNLPPPCSFYAKGTCKRGSECPYRHVLAVERTTSLKSYRNRYYGTDDPAAQAIINKNPELKDAINREGSIAALATSRDRTIKSLFVMGLRDGVDGAALEEFFGREATVEAVKLVAEGTGAIVTFKTRLEAEEAAQDHLGSVEIAGVRLKVTWAYSQREGGNNKKRAETDETKADDDADNNNGTANETTTKKPKPTSKPPPPPTSQNKPDYSSRHVSSGQ